MDKMLAEKEYDKYYEDALDRITAEIKLKTVSTAGHAWAEMDTLEDYNRAKDICAKYQYQNI